MNESYYSICTEFNKESISLETVLFIELPVILNTYNVPLDNIDVYLVKLPPYSSIITFDTFLPSS